MTDAPDTILLCTCEDGMRPDLEAVRRVFPASRIVAARHACGADLDRFRDAAAAGTALVACTAMAPLFRAVADSEGLAADLRFAGIRETAGWSSEGDRAGPKTAALIAAALESHPPPPSVAFESEGRTLVLGRDGPALDVARRLQEKLDVTLLLPDLSDVVPNRRDAFALAMGTVRGVRGHLGAFEIRVDGHAALAPSSRSAARPGLPAESAVLRADVIVDVTGGPPLLPAHDLRPGYLRADPRDPMAVAAALLAAGDLVGSFDKPRFVAFSEGLCAHSRSRRTGCRRCLDVCPTGAITPAGDHVAIDPHVCAGCGSCASVCPTGAAAYADPPADALMRRLRSLMIAWRAAGGGDDAVILLHDPGHGADLIDALARFGDGLPAHVLPVEVGEVTAVGPEQIAALFAYGASAVRILTRARPRHDPAALRGALALMAPVLSALGYGDAVAATIETDDPDDLLAALRAVVPGRAAKAPATFRPAGPKRAVFDVALAQLHAVAPTPVDLVALPAGAPFGRVRVQTDGCTLCLACTGACPTGALGDNPDRPMLTFDESLCVQCGLCAATCPERVIELEPRLRLARPPVLREVVKEEEPACCITCGKAFGTASSIERVIARLGAGHWMFADPARLDLLRMCDACRVGAVTRSAIDPYAGPPRARPMTSDDYLAARAANPEPDGAG